MTDAQGIRLKRKYQVFISSTFSDLKEHRTAAILGVVKARHMPIALENYPPDGEAKIKVIQDAIAGCQFYVIILGYRYGTVPTGQKAGEEKSYVEIELDYAQRQGLKVLAFVMDMSLVRELRRELKSPEDDAELGNYNKYLALRNRLTSDIDGTFHKPFSKPDDIWPELFAFFSQDHDSSGYILEPKDTSDANILQIYASNEIVRDVVQRLGQFEYVDPRLSVAPEKKQALAQAFLQRHGDHIEQTYRTVFFESGSTVNYVAKHLSGVLPKKGMSQNMKRYPLVLTNNAFAYLYLWLCSGVMCHPEPDGPPDQKYGGMYGPLTDRDRVPDYSLPELQEYDPDALTLIENLQNDMFGRIIEGREHSLLLAAASGLQISSDITAVDARDPKLPYTGEKILDQLRECRGFHVGSYQNKLFKRCLYLSRIPAVVFLHDDKIDCPIQVGKCHFLFDRGETWESFIKSYPISIWVACEQSNYEDVNDKLKSNLNLGEWSFKVYGDPTTYPIVIAYNAAFKDACTNINVNI